MSGSSATLEAEGALPRVTMKEHTLVISVVALIGLFAPAAGEVLAQQQKCYLRVNVKPCGHAVEIMIISGDDSTTVHLPAKEQDQGACLALTCDSNYQSTASIAIVADTKEEGRTAVVEPNQFGEKYDQLYTDIEQCMAGERNSAELTCESAVTNQELTADDQDIDQLEANIQWQNNWDQPLDQQCSDRQAFYQVKSTHDNGKEDRLWEWNCRANTIESGVSWDKCTWYNDQNYWDLPLMFQCPADYVMTGVKSYHDNGREDRRWSFECCHAPNYYTRKCYLTNYINSWDGWMDYSTGPPRVFVGAFSYHDNGKEDRIWKIMSCEYLRCESF